MARIFLSYARADRVCAQVLARVVEAAEHEVWWDRHIDSGEEFAAEIEAELDKADIVLVAWSKQSVRSRWVRDEAAVGGDSGRLVPVSLDGSQPPMGFRQFHTLDLTGWKGATRDKRTAELLRSIARRIDTKGKAAPAPRAVESARRMTWPTRRPLWAIAAVLMLMIAAVATFLFWNNRDQARGAPTFALLPFNTASPDAELRDLAAQARDSIAHTFSQSGLPVRLLSSTSQADRSIVDFLISGDLSRTADKIVATVRLDEAAQGVTVYSHRFESPREDARDLPERIGAQMAGNLAWGAPLRLLDRRQPLDAALLSDLLQGFNFTGDTLQAYQNAKRVAAKAPNVQPAQLGVAFYTGFVLAQLPREERADAVDEGRRAAQLAIKQGHDFGDTYATWCVLHSETLSVECEDRLRAGRRIDPDAPFLNTFLSHLLRAVGRVDESMDLARLAHAHDVYVPTKIAWMLKTSEYAGDSEAARELYQRGVRWWPEFQPMLIQNRLWGLIGRGDFEAILRLEQDAGPKNLGSDYQDSRALVLSLKSKSVGAAKRACTDADNFWLNVRCMLVLSRLGDQDSAFGIADKLYPRRVGPTPTETERIWLDDPDGGGPLEFITSPAAAPMRRDPRYLQMAQRVGLLDYWRSGRPPDFCRKQPEPICAQLRKQS